ncbi:MAG TPA: DUF1614 domain-containing protein [Candidatus Binataceae bacterium]|jgi:uncharacterized membrane protein|nr:DUF1614 domain-containing protein [Candidatus Binataceae bacterium]
MVFAPFVVFWAIVFFGLLFVWLLFVWVGVISNVFQALGLPPGLAFIALLASFLGSYINVPIAETESGSSQLPEVVAHYGMRYRIPVRYHSGRTTIAINVGGAIVPTLISLYVLTRFPSEVMPALIGVAIVTMVVNRFARPIPGLGIATPMFIPPIVAALCGYFLGGPHADAVAYVSGVLGTLIGADLLNIGKVSNLGAPVASIGGAGTFDGIFLTGIVAVLLA